MASLSEDDRKIIKDHPLNDSLDQLRRSLLDVERSYSLVSSLGGVDDRPEHLCQKAVSRLLYALQGEEVAFNLQWRISSRDVASEMARLFERVRNGDFSYTHYRPLVKLIIQKASDYDIWSAVLDLITTLSRVTPTPASVLPAFDSTPITHSSASQQGSEQTRRLVEARVFEEIRGCTYRDVQGFFEKYFEGKNWTDRARDVYKSIEDQHVDGKWVKLLRSTQNDVQNWLFQLQDDLLSNERRRYYTINVPNELTGGEARRQVDLIVKRESGKSSDTEHDWRDIEVIGELKASNNNGVKKTLVQLARYARDVFACQPTRRYLHAFTICGSSMEVWVFDRSGCYSPGPFDIHDKPERFIQVLAGYMMMDEDELGLDTFTERDGDHRFIHIEQEGAEMNRLQLRPDPLTRQRAIVCRGTSCYLTNSPDASESDNWSYVTKFSWTSDRRKPEADLLRSANQRGVQGIARLIGHRPITSIKEMRSGMTFTKPYSFRGTSSAASSFSQSFSQSQPPSILSRSFSELRGLTVAESTGERPKKRKSVDVGPKSKRSRSNSQRSSPPQNEVTYDVEGAQGTSLLAPSNDPYDNRIFRCLVIFPSGRPIHKYNSPLELLEALQDAIKAHRSLYFEGNILHRDISENNIIITDSRKTGFAGMLIDMDLAKELGSGRGGARCRTGTMEFMAIEVLLGISHTYRHDLESFFYVLLWQCARHGWRISGSVKDQPKDSLLTKWYSGTFRDIARIKRSDMGVDGFGDILDEFPQSFECVKPLCKELRGILFPYRDGLFTGTPIDPEILYGPIIKAFNKSIDEIKAMEG